MTLQITGYVSIPVTNDEGVQILKNVKQFRSLIFNYVSTPPSDDVTASTDMEITIARYPLSLNDPGVPIYWTGTTDTEETLADGSSCGIVLSRPGSYHIHAEEIDRGADDAIVETYDVYIEVLSLKDGTTCAFPTETTEFDETAVKEGWSRKMEYSQQKLSAYSGSKALCGFQHESDAGSGSGVIAVGDLVYVKEHPDEDAFTLNTDKLFCFSKTDITHGGSLGIVIDVVKNTGDEVYSFPTHNSEEKTKFFLVAFEGKFNVTNVDFSVPADSKGYFFYDETNHVLVESDATYIGRYFSDTGALLIDKMICNDIVTDYNVMTGTKAPVSTPNRIGAMYIDTVLDIVYVAKGTSSNADWIAVN